MLVRVTPHSGDGAGFTTTVESEEVLALPPGVARCRPIMLASPDARLIESGHLDSAAAFGPHVSESISSFVSFEVMSKVRDAEHAEQFVLNLPMVVHPPIVASGCFAISSVIRERCSGSSSCCCCRMIPNGCLRNCGN